ncbi:MAG: nuclear transport factor 2 family protein [Actinomycetota bacterium]|nr:nuclear transport factor 2 family protein [Actinomycetota bacterium]
MEAHERLIREAARAFNERDVDEVVALMHSEAEVKLIGGFDGVMGQHFQGEEGVRRFCQEWFTAFKTMTVGVERLFDAGERILIFSRLQATGTGSDAPVELLGAAIYSFRDGTIAAIDFYYDREQALEAAGLDRSFETP